MEKTLYFVGPIVQEPSHYPFSSSPGTPLGSTRSKSDCPSWRKLLRRANFTSTADLKRRIEHFIAYFNKAMAKPFKWPWAGKS